MKTHKLLLTCLALLAITPTVWSQEKISDVLKDRALDMKRPEVRAKAVARIKAIEKTRADRTRAKAKALGLPLRIQKADGGSLQIFDFDGDKPRYIETHNANAAISTGANLLQTSPYGLDGTGIICGVWDEGGVLTTHQEFAISGGGSRVTIKDGSLVVEHATGVAGTIGAQGTNAAAKGMAPNITIHSYDFNNDFSEMTSAAATASNQFATKIYLSNHSYGFAEGWFNDNGVFVWQGTGTDQNGVEPDFGRYSGSPRDLDAIHYSSPNYLTFWSAGNDRTNNPGPNAAIRINGIAGSYNSAIHPPGDGLYRNGFDTINGYAIAKNVVTVGNTLDAVTSNLRDPSKATLSLTTSIDPTDDGRIKPDLVANGAGLFTSNTPDNNSYGTRNGTSFSTPNAAGSAALIVDQYKRLFNGNLRASTLKSLLIHTATDIGNPGPDYKFGWGLLDAKLAVDIVRDHHANPLKTRIIENQVSTQTQTRTHAFLWDGVSPISATLCWTDPAGTGTDDHDSRVPTLVNNLHLKLIAPNGSEHLPYVMPFVGTWTLASMDANATTGINNTDNVEKIDIANPAQAGTWQAVVSYTGPLTNGTQDYGLILSGTAAAPYTLWTQQIFTNPFTLTAPTDDPDGDNLKNLQEFAFGTDPTIGAQTISYTPGGAVASGGPPIAMNLAVGEGVDYRAIFTRRKDHAAVGLTYTVQFSADMSNWVNSTDTPTILSGSSSATPASIEAVSVFYPFFVPVSDGGFKKPTFFRVSVAIP